MNAPAKIKTKKCKICREPFIPRNTIQPTCFKFECQLAYGIQAADRAKQRAEKIQRVKTREAKEAIKPLRKWMKEAQDAINRWVTKIRDADQPCISCEQYAERYDAGHYRSRGAASHLTFNEDNIHKQCSRPCNKDLSGNIVAYRIGLVKKIGLARVQDLEYDNKPHKWTIEEAKAVKKKYNELYKQAMKEIK